MPAQSMLLAEVACSSMAVVVLGYQWEEAEEAQVASAWVQGFPCSCPCLWLDFSLVFAWGCPRHNGLPKVADLEQSNRPFSRMISTGTSLVLDTLCSPPMLSHIGRKTMHSLRGAFCKICISNQRCPSACSPFLHVCGEEVEDPCCDVSTEQLQASSTGLSSGCVNQYGVDAT